jgi:hypothetical protein
MGEIPVEPGLSYQTCRKKFPDALLFAGIRAMMIFMRGIFVIIAFLGLMACGGPARRAEVIDPALRVQQILDESIDRGLNRLGQPGGYGSDAVVSIGLPEDLARAEKTLRRLGLERSLDELHTVLNRAAESVMAPAKGVLRQAAPVCFTPDPALLTAAPDAITRRFRKQCDDQLLERLRPVVADVLRQQSVTAAYRRLGKRLATLERAHETPRLDLESWLTRGVLDGIYIALADEERRARRARSGS